MDSKEYQQLLETLSPDELLTTSLDTEINSTILAVENRTINIPPTLKDIVVEGDSNSRKITFELNRFFDGVDLSERELSIKYLNAEGKSDYTPATNIQVGIETFYFDWIMDSKTSVVGGSVLFAIECYEYDVAQNKQYIWQTKPSQLQVESSFEVKKNAAPADNTYQVAFLDTNDNLETYSEIIGTDPVEDIVNRDIVFGSVTDLVVSGDTKSKIISFRVNRYYDNVDLSTKIIAIKFKNADGKSDRSSAVNIIVADLYIYFGWLVDSRVTYKDGIVNFAIEFLGYDEKGDFYCWQTKPSQINVEKGLRVDERIQEEFPSVLQEHELKLSELQNITANLEEKIDNVSVGDITTTSLISLDSGNSITVGSDDKLYLAVESLSGDASGVSYNKNNYATVEEALDALLYVAPVVSLSGGSTNEVGSTVTTVNLNWTINKNVTSQSFNNGIGNLPVGDRSYTHSGQSITSNRTYTLTVNDGTNAVNASTTVSFSHKRYWGVSSNDSLTDAQIRALSSEFSTNKTQTRTFDATGGRYLYIAYPASWGAASFKVGGFSYSGMELTVRNFVNASGNSTSFNIYRSPLQTGSGIVMEVS